MAKRHSRRNKRKRSGVRALKRSGFKGTRVDRTQSKMLVKLARQMKASKPELKLLPLGTNTALITMGGLNNPVDINSFTVFTPGRSINGAGLRPNLGAAFGSYLGSSIRPKAFHVKLMVKNTSVDTSFRFCVWTYWINFENYTGVDMDTISGFFDFTFPGRFYPGMLSTVAAGDNFDHAVTQYPAARRGALATASTFHEVPTRKSNWRFVSKNLYKLGPMNEDHLPKANHKELNYHFKFNPNSKWDFNINQPVDQEDPAIIKGWVPFVYILHESTSDTLLEVKATSRFYYRDS